LFKALAGEGPNYPHPGKLVAQHPVDAIDQILHAAEQWQHVRNDPVVGHGHHRDADQQEPGQRGLLMNGHDDAADAHDRRGDQHGGRGLHQKHDLTHVVGAAGQQRRGAEPGRFLLGEGDDVFEHRRAQVAAEAGTGPRAEVSSPYRAQHLQACHREHDRAQSDDGVGVPGRDAVVDDRGVDGGKIQRRQCADRLQHHQHRHESAIGPDVLAQQCQEHWATVAHRPRGGSHHQRAGRHQCGA
jgi:hypothetical protein